MNKQPLRVLFVEDDEDDYVLARDWFQEIDGERYILEWAKNYSDALKGLADTRYDVYLIDYRLGPHTGLELLQQATRKNNKAPMIILTGQGDRSIDMEAGRMGVADYLVKGEINADTLERAIRYALERKRSAIALQESEERYRNLFTHTPISICEEDFSIISQWLADMHVRSLSDFTRHVQEHPETLHEALRLLRINNINAASLALFEADSKPAVVAALRELFKGAAQDFFVKQLRSIWNGKNDVKYEISINTLKGNPLHCVLHWAVSINDDRFDLSNTILTIVDITERVRAERALAQAQKMEGLGVLAGGVAHDFNNLLVAMLGQTSLALSHLPPASPARSSVEKAVKATRRAAELVRQILVYSGRAQLEMRPIHLNDLIRENLHLFESAPTKNIQLHANLAGMLPMIEGDSSQMQQVIMNLILNAIDAIGDQPGAVNIATGVQHVSAGDDPLLTYTDAPLRPGRYVKLEVDDNGCGMDAETLSKIFDPFFTTKFTGHGLGLAAVLGMVHAHKGGLQVISAPGQGSTFTLLFPALAITPAENPPPQIPRVTLTAYGTILVIDDEEPVREAITDILEAEGWQMLTAAKGELGIALYREHMAEIRLVLLDLSLPHMSGEEIFYALREINPHARILLSSGYHEIDAMRRFSDKGPLSFIQKPYDADTLIETVRRCLA